MWDGGREREQGGEVERRREEVGRQQAERRVRRVEPALIFERRQDHGGEREHRRAAADEQHGGARARQPERQPIREQDHARAEPERLAPPSSAYH